MGDAITEIEKLHIVTEARSRLVRDVGHDHQAACLQAAFHATHVLLEHGYQAALCAGSAFWAYSPENETDKTAHNAWGYGFNPETNPPELHAWAAIHDDGKEAIVDITTRHWPLQYLLLTQKQWPGPFVPPDFLWGMDAMSSYSYDLEASRLAIAMIPDVEREKINPKNYKQWRHVYEKIKQQEKSRVDDQARIRDDY